MCIYRIISAERKGKSKIYKLIIIDDEIYTCEGLKKMLDWKSCNVEIAGTANDGADGLKLAQTIDPDIIITDINMPMMSGLDMVEALRGSGYDGKIIILTGYRYFEYAKRAIDNRTNCYLLKPVDIVKLREAVLAAVSELDKYKRNKVMTDKSESDLEIKKILDYVNEHYAENISLHDISRIYYMDESYISKLFKSYVGKNFIAYITDKRAEKAKSLLAETNMSVEDVMLAVGYKDVKHFRNIFKASAGMPPAAYRKMLAETDKRKGENKDNDGD